MARGLIVGCGCRGRELGARLREDGWEVRGTTRDPARAGPIEARGLEAAIADPDRVGSVLDLVGDVTVLCWLLGSARGEEAELAALHGPRLARLLAELVDTPVRGIVYEAAGSVRRGHLDRGIRELREARERWRIPFAVIESDPGDVAAWTDAAHDAVRAVIA